MIIWSPSFPLCWPGGHYSTHKSPYKFTQQALNDSQQNLSLLNSEMALMRKAKLQNRMDLGIISASQRDTCAIIQKEHCEFIPDVSVNVSSLLIT